MDDSPKSILTPGGPGFPIELYEHVQKALTAKPQRSLAFQDRNQRNTAFLRKGLSKPGSISYDTLRRVSQSVHVVRICIHTLKMKTTKTEWVIQNKDVAKRKTGREDKRIEEVTRFFRYPNNTGDNFRTLLEKMAEDLLVLDAVSLEKTRYPNGKLAELHFVDSATIRPVYDERGNQDVIIPLATKEAAAAGEKYEDLPVSYVQVLDNSQYGGPESGEIVAAWPKRDFIHFHANPQGAMESFGYGLSPIEGIISVVSNLLNVDNFNSTFFEEGAFPPIVLQLIGQVNQRDLEAYREYLVAELSGNFHRPAIMATEKAESLQIHNLKDATNHDMQMMEYQEWLARLCCAMYGLAAQEIGLTQDVGSKNVAEEQSELAQAKGYASMLDLFAEVFNQDIIWRDFGYEDLEFAWVATDQMSQDEQSQTYDRDLRNGSKTINEVREARGDSPFGDWADEPMLLATDGYVLLDPEKKQKQMEDAEAKAQEVGGEKPYQEQENEVKKVRKAVLTQGGYRTWADDRGFSQPFIFMDVKTGRGMAIKPPVAVNLQSQELEVNLTQELAARGLNVVPVSKMSYVEVMNMLASIPEVWQQFQNYVAMTEEYDSEKWRAKFGGSRKFNYYLVSDYVDGFALSNPLLLDDMKRDPDSYRQAARDLGALWRVEKELVLGDRRADQYIIDRNKRAWGFDYQFMGDESRWERTKDAVPEALDNIPRLYKDFKESSEKEEGAFKSLIKRLRR